MHEALVRQVEQIVIDELIVRSEMVIARDRDPLGIVHPMEVRDAGGIGQRGIAHPDPREGVPLD